MEKWRRVWREGFAPLMTLKGLLALREAAINDDPRLAQGVSVTPIIVRKAAPEMACGVSFCGWHGLELATSGDVWDYFNLMCDAADLRIGEQAICRYFLTWFDETPRAEMRREMIAETTLAIDAKENR